jgi:hypothetical protein
MAMLIKRGSDTVTQGTYWNLSTGQRVDIKEEGVLPGDSKTMFIRLNPVALLLAGPFIGLLFAVFLPFIGIAMTVLLIGRKVAESAVDVAVKSTSFGWKPIEAYLEGRRKGKKGAPESTRDDKR